MQRENASAAFPTPIQTPRPSLVAAATPHTRPITDLIQQGNMDLICQNWEWVIESGIRRKYFSCPGHQECGVKSRKLVKHMIGCPAVSFPTRFLAKNPGREDVLIEAETLTRDMFRVIESEPVVLVIGHTTPYPSIATNLSEKVESFIAGYTNYEGSVANACGVENVRKISLFDILPTNVSEADYYLLSSAVSGLLTYETIPADNDLPKIFIDGRYIPAKPQLLASYLKYKT
jgi:hypothetical protein